MGVLSKMAGALGDYSYLQVYWLGQAGLLTLVYTLQVLRGTYNDNHKCEKGLDEKLGLLEFRKRFPAQLAVGLGWMGYTLWTLISSYHSGTAPAEIFQHVVDFFTAPRTQHADHTRIIIASSMFLIHILRRLYESSRISIYSRRQVVGPIQVALTYVYYAAAGLTLIADGPAFGLKPELMSVSSLGWYHVFALGMFLHGSKLQYKSFTQLAKMRRNRAGHIVTTAHKMPKGGQFEAVSCPQYLGEIMVYGSIAIALGFRHTSWNMLLLYVVATHLVKARGVHMWYRNKFQEYPKARRMLIPYLL